MPPSRTIAASAPLVVLLEPVDDRMPADLLLPVAGEADVDGQLACARSNSAAFSSMNRCALSSATPRA